MSELATIFYMKRCDKGSNKHFYHTVYEKELENFRNSSSFKLLEVGVLEGAGIASWLEYFPNARKIVGLDLFDRVSQEDVAVLSNPKVQSIKADSTKVVLSEHLSPVTEKFDVIIDDGMHSPRANRETFVNLIPYLKKTGTYFIEDVWPLDVMTKRELNHRWIRTHQDRFNDVEYSEFLDALKNYDVQRFDLRRISGHPDSYIFKVKHKKSAPNESPRNNDQEQSVIPESVPEPTGIQQESQE